MNSLLLFCVCTSRSLWRLEWLIDNAWLSSPLFSQSPSAFRCEVAKMNGAVDPIIWATAQTLQSIWLFSGGVAGGGLESKERPEVLLPLRRLVVSLQQLKRRKGRRGKVGKWL